MSPKAVGVRRRPKIPGHVLDAGRAVRGALRLGDGTAYLPDLEVVTPTGHVGRALYSREPRTSLGEPADKARRIVVEGGGAWLPRELKVAP